MLMYVKAAKPEPGVFALSLRVNSEFVPTSLLHMHGAETFLKCLMYVNMRRLLAGDEAGKSSLHRSYGFKRNKASLEVRVERFDDCYAMVKNVHKYKVEGFKQMNACVNGCKS